MNIFYWYTLRINTTKEESVVTALKEQINFLKLQDSIIDIQFCKEYKIEKSEEYPFNCELLLQKGIKNTDINKWVKLNNGYIQNIKLIEKKPFRGLIFIKMKYDLKLFNEIKSWFSKATFVGYANPIPISDQQFSIMVKSIEFCSPINLDDYLKENNLNLYEPPLKDQSPNNIKKKKTTKRKQLFVLNEKDIFQQKNDIKFSEKSSDIKNDDLKTEDDKLENKKDLTSDKVEKNNIVENESANSGLKQEIKDDETINKSQSTINLSKNNKKESSIPKVVKKKILFSLNDEVNVKALGSVGTIQSINENNETAVVLINFFGRQQILQLKFNEIELINLNNEIPH